MQEYTSHRLVFRSSMFRKFVLECGVRQSHSTVIGNVFAKRQLAGSPSFRGAPQTVVFFYEAVCQFLKLFAILFLPPIAQVPEASNSRPSSSNPCVSSWPMMLPAAPKLAESSAAFE